MIRYYGAQIGTEDRVPQITCAPADDDAVRALVKAARAEWAETLAILAG